MNEKRALVTGAGGFIGHHLVRYLKKKGYWVRGVDIKKPEYSPKEEADEFLVLDLRSLENCLKATEGMDEVYALAANMGGVGFFNSHNADIMYDNVSINANTAEASKRNGVKRLFFSSSACVYPVYKQEDSNSAALKESDVYPADPDKEYGWEKLFSEILYKSYAQFYEVRIGRYHNIFGPEGTYEGGREKAPAALCRKVAIVQDGGELEIWGDGEQTRSFLFVDDCVVGTFKLMESDFKDPLNIGSDRLTTINNMVDILAKIAASRPLSWLELADIISKMDKTREFTLEEIKEIITKATAKRFKKKHLLDKPQGVRGRNSDNTLCKKVLNWEPKISLEEGLKRTYEWLVEELKDKGKLG